MKRIILASKSPRRKALLEKIGLKFEVIPSNYKESFAHKLPPETLVKKLALEKAQTVAKKYKDAIVIGGDTIIVFENQIIGKPRTPAKAKQLLKQYSGKSHLVISAYAIIDTNTNKTIINHESTRVYFKNLIDKEINEYVKSGEPLDKGGGYAIQEKGGTLIEKIAGDYDTVVGLPLNSLKRDLLKIVEITNLSNK